MSLKKKSAAVADTKREQLADRIMAAFERACTSAFADHGLVTTTACSIIELGNCCDTFEWDDWTPERLSGILAAYIGFAPLATLEAMAKQADKEIGDIELYERRRWIEGALPSSSGHVERVVKLHAKALASGIGPSAARAATEAMIESLNASPRAVAS